MPSSLRQVKARFPHAVYERIERDARREKRSVAAQVAYLVEKIMGPVEETAPMSPAPVALPRRRGRSTPQGDTPSAGYSGTLPRALHIPSTNENDETGEISLDAEREAA